MAQASFIKINKKFGFNRYRLAFWNFSDDMAEVTLTFDNGDDFFLDGADCETFRNWTMQTGEDAPITHQATMWPH